MTRIDTSPPSAFKRGYAAHAAGDLAAAEAAYREALAAAPEWPAAHNLGALLNQLCRYGEAEHCLRLAIDLRPQEPSSWSALGQALAKLQRLTEAELYARRALALADTGPHRYRLSVILLQQGRSKEAWPLFESRPGLETIPLRDVRYPQWRGESLTGRRILVWGEQGLGDEVQFGRFIQTLKDRGAAHVSVACRPPNIRLFRYLGADLVLAREGKLSIPPHDFWTPMMSLPYRLGLEAEQLTGAPYISAPRARGRGVAIVSTGNPANGNDIHRSIRDGRLRRALPNAVEIEPRGDMLDGLAAISGFAAVVSVDTVWAHLAGAAGLPCHILVSTFGADWRWRAGAPDTPWYRSAHLHWQTTPGDWTDPIATAAAELAPSSGSRSFL